MAGGTAKRASGATRRAIGLAALLAATAAALPAAGRRSDPLAWPPVRQETRPWTRWWWHGSAVETAALTACLEAYARVSLGGVEITPIYGVRGYENRFLPYLSAAWMDRLEHTLREAQRLGLGVDLATGTGWPFGGPWVDPASACKTLVHRTMALGGGGRLREPVRAVQEPLVRAVGRRVTIAAIREPLSANDDLQALALAQVRFPRRMPLVALVAAPERGEAVDLTDRVAADGSLDWTAPPGRWTLHAFFQGWHGKLVERAAPGGEGDVIDHFSGEALRRYLDRFDRAFAGRNTRGIRAFFNDSYEVDDAVGESNWTPDLLEEFRRRRGYDLRPWLPALFGAADAETAARVRCDYRETLSDLLLERFTLGWRRWAAGRGAIVRNQAHGSPANILDLYAASDIPETEGAEPLRIRFAASAAHVAGRRLVSAETATWVDEHFLSTLGRVREAVDRLFLGGVNHIVYHGTPYSPPEDPWPGFLFYASVHFGPTNSFWVHFPALNAYVTRCQSFLQAGEPDSDLLLYFPIHERWSVAGSRSLEHFHGPEGTAAEGAAARLLRGGYAFDFVSDRQIARLRFEGGRLRAPGGRYRAVVLPGNRLVPAETFEKLAALARLGASIVVLGDLPADVPGLGRLQARRERLRRALADLRFEPLRAGVKMARVGGGRFLLAADPDAALQAIGVPRERMGERSLSWVRRRLAGGSVYFIRNDGSEPVDDWVPLGGSAAAAALFDPMTGERGLGAVRPSLRGGTEVYLQLAPGESRIVRTLDAGVEGPAWPYRQRVGAPRALDGTWRVRFLSGGPELPPPADLTRLESWTRFGGEAGRCFSGSAVYRLDFPRPEGRADAWELDLGRVAESASVRLNGEELGTLIQPPFRLTVPAARLAQRNVLEVVVANLMANRIADLDRRGVPWKKFYNINFPPRLRENAGPDGLFDASRWSPRDSGLLGPVTLTPLETWMPR